MVPLVPSMEWAATSPASTPSAFSLAIQLPTACSMAAAQSPGRCSYQPGCSAAFSA